MSRSTSELRQRIAKLTPRQRELLARRLGGPGPRPAAEPATEAMAEAVAEAATGSDLPRLVARPDERHEPFPLSEVQETYWIGRQGVYDLSGGGANTYFELHVERPGEGWVERLPEVLDRLVGRHEMLRSVVLPDGRQRILAEVPSVPVRALDLSSLPEEAAETRLAAVRERLRYRPGRIDEWPLFDVVAHRLAGGALRLHFRFEASLVDGDSRNIFFRELFRLLDDPAAELPPVGCSYRDYVLTWRDAKDSPLYRRAEAWWRDRLDDLPPAPELPLAAEPSPEMPSRLAFRSIRLLPVAAWRRLVERAHGLGLTPSALAVAAFAEVLAAWSRDPRFTLSLDGSYRPPIDDSIGEVFGNFNTVLLLACDGRSGSFADRASQLAAASREALDHWQFSGLAVLRELGRRRGATGSVAAPMPVVFNSLIEYSHESYRQPEIADAFRRHRVEFVDAGPYLPQIHLFLSVAEYEHLFCRWQATEGLFAEGVMEAMSGAYGRLLADLADGGGCWQRDEASLAAWLVPAEQCSARPAGCEVRDPRGAPRPDWVEGELWRSEGGGEPAPTGRRARWLPGGRLEELPDAAPAAKGTGYLTCPRPAAADPGRAPSTALERDLAALWCRLLAVDSVSLGDDLFARGGDSLAVARLAAALRREHGFTLPVHDFFRQPTFETLAALLAQEIL